MKQIGQSSESDFLQQSLPRLLALFLFPPLSMVSSCKIECFLLFKYIHQLIGQSKLSCAHNATLELSALAQLDQVTAC